MTDDDYLDTQDACAYLDFSEAWLQRRRKEGLLRGYHLDDNRKKLYYRKSDLDDLRGLSTVSEVAHMLDVSRAYIQQLIKAGRVHAIDARQGGERPYWLIAHSEVERLRTRSRQRGRNRVTPSV